MKQSRVVRRRCLHEFYPTAPNPAEALDEQQHAKHDDEPHVELVPENRHGETSFRHRIPRLLVKVLNLGGPERPIEDELEGMAEEYREEE